jgi:phosphatidate cytidylyltransferase
LRQRLITGLVGAPIVFFLIAASPWLTLILVFALALIAVHEFLRLTNHNDSRFFGGFSAALSLLMLAGWALSPFALLVLCGLSLVIVLIVWRIHWLAPWGVAGVAYLGLPLACFINLRFGADGLAWVFLMLFATWGTDIGAYLIGRSIGHIHFTPISPEKTMEGTLGGLLMGVGGVLVVALASDLWQTERPTVLAAALLLPPMAVLGDLLESKIKRTYGKKDSGRLLPGHGGILDRLDSILFTAPALWLLVYLF